MILIVGASGRLGGAVARMLLAEGKSVRSMSRTPELLEPLKMLGADVVSGDVLDPQSLARACVGVEKVVASVQALTGTGRNSPRTVDDAGNRALIDAAKAAGVRHFVFISASGARPDHPFEFFRIKYGVEAYLRDSGLNYTILRPTAFMEFWATMVGEPILEKGQTTIFGRGLNPISFVSVEDVARLTVTALGDPAAHQQVLEIGGPHSLSMRQVAETFERFTGKPAKRNHVPLPMMRIMTVVMRSFNPALSRQIGAGIIMDTHDQRVDMTATLNQFPMRLTTLEEVVQKRFAAS